MSHVPAPVLVAVALGGTVALGTGAWLLARRYRRRHEIMVKYETMAGPLRIYTIRRDDGRLARVMDVDGAFQSATYMDDDSCYELVFGYHRAYDALFEPQRPVDSVLMLGGGGYAYPEHLVSEHADVHVDVVEIDPDVTAIARRYFFLERLMVEFDTDETGQLEIFHEDARAFLERTDRRYSAIVNDCFAGRTPTARLATIEAARAVHAHLKPGGCYLSNVIGSLEGPRSRFLNSVVATLGQVFAYVYVVPGTPDEPTTCDNNVVIATDEPYTFEGALQLATETGTELLEDARAHEQEWHIPLGQR